LNLAQAKRHYKQSQREFRHWKDEVLQIVSKVKLQKRMELQAHRRAKERAILGGVTQEELLNEIDKRTPELTKLVTAYIIQEGAQKQAVARHQDLVEQQKKKLILDRKMEMVEALDKFPKAYNEAILTLNSLLYARSPRDPPPPRRSKRSRSDEDTAPSQRREKDGPGSPKRKRAKTANTAVISSSPNDVGEEETWSQLAASLATASAAGANFFDTKPSASVVDVSAMLVTNTSADASTTHKHQKKLKDSRNIGGWISPHFSQELDRSWLARTKPLRPASVVPRGSVGKGDNVTTFDLKGWVPQVGDVVLYYPSAHKVCKSMSHDSKSLSFPQSQYYVQNDLLF
jgi:hypothetical protein